MGSVSRSIRMRVDARLASLRRRLDNCPLLSEDDRAMMWRALRKATVQSVAYQSPVMKWTVWISASLLGAGSVAGELYLSRSGLLFRSYSRTAILLGLSLTLIVVLNSIFFDRRFTLVRNAGWTLVALLALLDFTVFSNSFRGIQASIYGAGTIAYSFMVVIYVVWRIAALVSGPLYDYVVRPYVLKHANSLSMSDFVGIEIAMTLLYLNDSRSAWRSAWVRRDLLKEIARLTRVIRSLPRLSGAIGVSGSARAAFRSRSDALASFVLSLEARLADARSQRDYDTILSDMADQARRSLSGDWSVHESGHDVRYPNQVQIFLRWGVRSAVLVGIAVALPRVFPNGSAEAVVLTQIALVTSAALSFPGVESSVERSAVAALRGGAGTGD